MENGSASDVYRTFFVNSFDAAFVLDEACRIIDVNAAAAALTGRDRAALVGQPLEILLPAEVASGHGGHVQAYLQRRGRSALLGRPRRFEIQNADGDRIPIELKAFDLGAASKPAAFGAVMVDLSERERLEAERARMLERMQELALTDELTGLPNRRAFMEALERAHAQVRRHGGAVSVAVIDIDHFKRINDTLGHDVGDAVLKATAAVLADDLRADDCIGRLGGEEFGVILSGSAVADAVIALERTRLAVRSADMPGVTVGVRPVTASVGVADLHPNATTGAALKAADAAMYAAKQRGRDRVERSPAMTLGLADAV